MVDGLDGLDVRRMLISRGRGGQSWHAFKCWLSAWSEDSKASASVEIASRPRHSRKSFAVLQCASISIEEFDPCGGVLEQLAADKQCW